MNLMNMNFKIDSLIGDTTIRTFIPIFDILITYLYYKFKKSNAEKKEIYFYDIQSQTTGISLIILFVL